MRFVTMAVVAALMVSGCSGAIFKRFNLKQEESITTGARQRVVVNHNPNLMSRQGSITPSRIVCIEPSPDVASIAASSFSAGIAAAGYGSGSVASSNSEALAQLAERTTSVQLLRERMFRACEAYSNGAITSTTYTLLMARFDRAMATVLFGEVMGGAFGRSLAAIGSKSNADSSSSMLSAGDAISNINEAADALASAEKELQEAEKALAEENAKPTPDMTRVETLTKARDEARGKRDATRQLLQTHVATAAKAASDATSLTAAGGIASKSGADSHREMAKVFSAYLDSNPLDDYIAACLVELERGAESDVNALREYSQSLLAAKGAKPIDEHEGRTLAVLAPFGRKSGLFAHCQRHLADITGIRQSGIVSLKGYEMELRKQELQVQAQEARGQATEAFGNAIKQCNEIQVAPIKEQCLNTIDVLQKQDPDSASQAFQDFERNTNLATQGEVLPTSMLDRVSGMIGTLTDAKDKLDGLSLTAPTVDPTKSAEEQEATRDRIDAVNALNVRKAFLVQSATMTLGQATNETTATKRQTSRDLENKRSELRGKLLAAQTELEKEKYQAALRVQFLEATELFDAYAELLGKMEANKSDLEVHTARMKAAGAT